LNQESEVRVWVDAPISKALTYSCAHLEFLPPGSVVTVPLGKRKSRGIVFCVGDDSTPSPEESANIRIKPIDEVRTQWPALKKERLKWIEWLSEYYLSPPGPIAMMGFPPLDKKSGRSRKHDVVPATQGELETPWKLNEEQATVFSGIGSQLDQFGVHLLLGATGSGKTEIYLQSLAKVLENGKSGIVLVPEIALTPQLIRRFSMRFGSDLIAVFHSQLTPREKTNQWWDCVEGRKRILIGARSALFCPIADLGMIVIDEEHEASFKQHQGFKYHARDAAIVLAQLLKIPLVMGSATPSIESYANALSGKYQLHVMKHRVESRSLPTIEVVDLKNLEESGGNLQHISASEQTRNDSHQDDSAEARDTNTHSGTSAKKSSSSKEDLPWLSPLLESKMLDRLRAGEQIALFLNRRGLAQGLVCTGCGSRKECPNCTFSLTLHAKTHLVCHLCGYFENYNFLCGECGEYQLMPLGIGTEKVERELALRFPSARILRADRDEIQNREDTERFVDAIEKGEVDIVVGTQMIAKGLDFENLTLVGLLVADIGFNLPDLRATERSFQLLTQMSGRAGRHKPGEVVIQTFNPYHTALKYALSHDYIGFAEYELEQRKVLSLPPYGRVILLEIKGSDEAATKEWAKNSAATLKQWVRGRESFKGIDIIGPTSAPIYRVRNKYRQHIVLKGLDSQKLRFLAGQWTDKFKKTRLQLSVDVDPIDMM